MNEQREGWVSWTPHTVQTDSESHGNHGKQGGSYYWPWSCGKCSINVINANRIRLCTNNTEISPGLTLKNLEGETVRYLSHGTRMPASLPGSWHQARAPSAHSNSLHFQIYDCMINEDFILPSATLQSAFPISKGAAITQEDWFLILIWSHNVESTFLMQVTQARDALGFDRFI